MNVRIKRIKSVQGTAMALVLEDHVEDVKIGEPVFLYISKPFKKFITIITSIKRNIQEIKENFEDYEYKDKYAIYMLRGIPADEIKIDNFITLTDVQNESIQLSNKINIEMILVEAGTFMMGSPESEKDRYSDERQHTVKLTKDYYIGKYPVTQAQWEVVTGNNPSEYKGTTRPVEEVSWKDAQEFIKKLNEKTGKNFRSPTEAEWEYAARGGNKSKGYIYSGSNNINEVAWYWENSMSANSSSSYKRETMPVGQKKPNELGIYDMSGNVWEWCSDWFGDYPSGNATDPIGIRTGSNRVDRGGSWFNYAKDCRSALRGRYSPDYRYNDLGFRLCLPAGR